MNLCVRKQTNGIALFFMTFLPSLPFWAIFNDNHGVFLLFPCYFLSKKVISAINKKKCLEIIFINFKFKFTRPQARGDCEKPDQARVHLKKCVCDCRQAGDSFRSCYNEKPLWKTYLPDERLLRRSGRTWPHVEAVPLHSGTADACDYDKCS